jgi:S1-C subfamily serine protease
MSYSVPNRKHSKFSLAGLLVLALLIGGLAGWFIGRTNANAANPDASINPAVGNSALTQVAENFRTSVVQINVQLKQGASIGSGVIIDPRGYIVTNNHVIAGGNHIQVVLYDNTSLAAQITGTDPPDDLAVVKINPSHNLSVAKFGDSSTLKVGQPVLAIGNPLGITQTVTSGIVSALGRTVSEGQNSNIVIVNAIQTDAPINPGNSGGALVDLQNELVGIPTLVPIDPEFNTPAAGVGFAIPANHIKFITRQLISQGHIVNSGRATIGIKGITVDDQIQQQLKLSINHGVLVVGVVANGPAQQGGIQQGDVIVQIDNTPVNDVTVLQDILANKQPGTTIAVQVNRNGQPKALQVKLGELQVKPQDQSS